MNWDMNIRLIYFINHIEIKNMQSLSKNAFYSFIKSIGEGFEFEEVWPWAEKQFAINYIKTIGISMEQCVSCYENISKKYTFNLIQEWPDEWHQNQKKVFVQVLLCFCKSRKKHPSSLMAEDWSLLSSIIFGKSPLFLKFQTFQFLKLQHKSCWSIEDDSLIIQFISKCGEGNWNEISKLIFYETKCSRFFSAKQIRERWNNHLRRCLNKGPWSEDEDAMLLNYVASSGKRWSYITRLFNKTRTEHMIKNRFHFLTSKYEKHCLSGSSKIVHLIQHIKDRQNKNRTKCRRKLDIKSKEKIQKTVQQQESIISEKQFINSQESPNSDQEDKGQSQIKNQTHVVQWPEYNQVQIPQITMQQNINNIYFLPVAPQNPQISMQSQSSPAYIVQFIVPEPTNILPMKLLVFTGIEFHGIVNN